MFSSTALFLAVIALCGVREASAFATKHSFFGNQAIKMPAAATTARQATTTMMAAPDDFVRITPDDAYRYPSMTMGFNMRWKASNCEAIYLCNTAGGVATAVDIALKVYGKNAIKVVSGAHCYENFVFNENTKVIINVSPLNDWGYDDDKGYWLSSGFTNWGAFKVVFQQLGKVIPGGSCYSVGLGGHISGGGDGVLSRLHGLTVDWLTGVEVVVKPGDQESDVQLKYVSASSDTQEERDLFWAHTGGGGGNFGVITKYYFKTLPDAPIGCVVSVLHFDWNTITKENLAATLDLYFDLAMDDQLGPNNDDSKRRTVGKFQIHHMAAGEFQMYLQTAYYDDDQKAAAQQLHYELETAIENSMPTCQPTRVLGGHGGWFSFPKRERKRFATASEFITDETNVYPFYQSTQTINSSGPNQRGKYKSAYMKDKFPPEQIDAIWYHLRHYPDGLTLSDMKDSLLQCDIFAGAINDKTSDETAIYQRQYYVKLQYQTYWQEESKDTLHQKWISDFYQSMYEPYGGIPDPVLAPDLFEGCYYNYPDVDLNDLTPYRKNGALYLYFLDNIKKLSEVKQTWDPNDYFQHAQSIPPNPDEVQAMLDDIAANGRVGNAIPL